MNNLFRANTRPANSGGRQGIGFWTIGITVLALAGLVVVKSPAIQGSTAGGEDLRILKSQVTSRAKFYPYTASGIKMEVLAVKASDGTIRTAFNTCQVCFDSGRGFYTQEGDELVCNNCGNRFQIDQVSKLKFGCNPIPIPAENRTDSGQTITISKTFLEKNKVFFTKWKKN